MSHAFNNASFLGTELITNELGAAHAYDEPDGLKRLGSQLAHADQCFKDAFFLTSFDDYDEAAVLLGTCRAYLEQALATLDRYGVGASRFAETDA